MEFLGKHAIGKVLQDDALKVSSEAKNAKKNDPAVIDGTLGTFYYEDGTFKSMEKNNNNICELYY